MNAVLGFRRGAARPEPRRTGLRMFLAALATLGCASVSDAALEEPNDLQITPPRLGYVDGQVSFWRPGAGDWEAAQVNLPMAAGDALATQDGQVELQIGGRSYLRVGSETQVRVRSLEPDFLQIEVTAGQVVVDLRDLSRGFVVEVDTPNAHATMGRDGYYRVDARPDSTQVVVRRAGQATVAPNGGQAVEVATGDAVQIDGSNGGQFTVVAAPAFDGWDRWNYDRADRALAAPRSYAVSSDIYGAEELETNGTWRYVNTYGRVWVPNSVPAGWAPYTQGRWTYDPFYGWAWVDAAPWGWAPFHYGRWVYSGFWGWAPGPVVVAPVYAPALVAFFGGPGFSVSIGVPFVSWVALGWGEPLLPWWGPVGFVGSPCWWGWGGPRIVNNIIINNGDTINANSINQYRNLRAPGGVNGVDKARFTSKDLSRIRMSDLRADQLKPIRGKLPGDHADLAAARRGDKALPGRAGGNTLADGRTDGAPGSAKLVRLSPSARSDGSAPPSLPKTSAHRAGYDTRRGDALPSRQSETGKALPDSGARALRRAAQPPPLKAPQKSANGTAAYDRVRSGEPSQRAPSAYGQTGEPRAVDKRGYNVPPRAPQKSANATGAYDRVRSGAPSQRAPSAYRGSTQPRGGDTRSYNVPPRAPQKSASATGAYDRMRSRAPSTYRSAAPAAAPSGVDTGSNYVAPSGQANAAAPRYEAYRAAPSTGSAPPRSYSVGPSTGYSGVPSVGYGGGGGIGKAMPSGGGGGRTFSMGGGGSGGGRSISR